MIAFEQTLKFITTMGFVHGTNPPFTTTTAYTGLFSAIIPLFLPVQIFNHGFHDLIRLPILPGRPADERLHFRAPRLSPSRVPQLP